MKRKVLAFALLAGVALGVAEVQGQQPRGLKPEADPRARALPGGLGAHNISLAEVPAAVRASASRAVPGAAFNKALWYNADDWRVYRLEGGRFSERVVVDVREDGKVVSAVTDNR